MTRLVIIGAALAFCATAAAWAQAPVTTAEGQRGLTYELGPKLPEPEKEAHADPRFAAAARYTAARQISSVAAALVMIAALMTLHFSGAGARLARVGGARPVVATLAVSGAVGAAVAVPLMLAYVARAVFLSGAGGELSVGAVVVKPLCCGVAVAALAFVVGATRPLWPRMWWIAATFACVAAAVCWIYVRPLPPAEEPSSPAAGFLLERARYLSAQYQMPAFKIAVARRLPAGELVAAAVPPGRRTVVVSAGAELLNRYEAEVFLAGAVTRAEAGRKSFLGPAALVFFMASLIIADAVARAWARRRGGDGAEPADLLPFAAVLVALWSAALVAYNGWSRGLWLAADEEVIRLTRKPIAAVTLYYGEARANLDAAEPNPVLHFLADAKPSPAERAALARRLRRELAAGQ